MLDTSSLGTDIVTVLFVPVLLINIFFFLDGANRHLTAYGYFRHIADSTAAPYEVKEMTLCFLI